MSQCPVCDTKYDQGQANSCTTCGWNLTLYSSGDGIPEGFGSKVQALQQVEAWAKKIWSERSGSQLSKSQSEPALSEEVKKLQDDLNQSKQKGEQLLSKLKESEREKNKLRSQVAELGWEHHQRTQCQLIELNELLKQNSERIKRLEQAEKERSQLQSDIEQLQKGQEEHKPKLEKLETQLQQLQSQRSDLQSQLSKLAADLQQVKLERSQTQANQDTLSSPVSELKERLDPSKEDLSKLANHQVSSSPSSTASSKEETTTAAQDTQKSDSQFQQLSNYPPPSSEESTLVEKYNSERDSLSDIAKEVSETEESQNQRRLGTSQSAVFETSRRGNYWIITQGGFEYLVPKGNFKINKFNYTTVEFLFECQGYQSGQSKDFKLIKPAKVSCPPGGEKWQLVELGILQFQSSE